MSLDDGCPVRVYGGYGNGHVCGRTIKRDGMCGMHAAAAERKVERKRQFDEEWDRRGRERERIAALIQQLAGFGINAEDAGQGRVAIVPEYLIALLTKERAS